jgi:hypothetical protein
MKKQNSYNIWYQLTSTLSASMWGGNGEVIFNEPGLDVDEAELDVTKPLDGPGTTEHWPSVTQKIAYITLQKALSRWSKRQFLNLNYGGVPSHRFSSKSAMFVERNVRYPALFTNLFRWHAGAVSFPLSDIILA